MGFLILAPMYFVTKALIKGGQAAGRAAKNAAAKIPQRAQQRLQSLEQLLAIEIPPFQSSHDFARLLNEQMAKAKRELGGAGLEQYAEYLAAKTTPLGQYLPGKTWHELATGRVAAEQLLAQARKGYRLAVAQSLKSAFRQSGFSVLKKEKDSASEQKHYLSVSDGEGHGLKVVIQEGEQTGISIDQWGYAGNECDRKLQEVLAALKQEGIELDDPKVIHHRRPDGYQHVKEEQDEPVKQQTTHDNTIRRRQQLLIRR